MHEKLTEDTFIPFAMRHYENQQCHSIEEFEDDLKRFLYLKKLFTRYKLSGELRERLIVNHIVILYNLFGNAATKMLFHKIDPDQWSYLITVLIFLNRMPEYVPEYSLRMTDIPLDQMIVNALRNL
jgi:hypothetical protein